MLKYLSKLPEDDKLVRKFMKKNPSSRVKMVLPRRISLDPQRVCIASCDVNHEEEELQGHRVVPLWQVYWPTIQSTVSTPPFVAL